MRKDIIVHSFEGIVIQQRHTDGYLNLNQMAKACGKRIDNWMRLKETTSLLSEFRNSPEYQGLEPIITIEGRNGGSWGHPDIAIQFAQWCDPGFALQVSRWVREWLTTGVNPVQASVPILSDFERELAFLKTSAEMLRPSEASTIGMLTRFGKIHHCDTGFLPEYTEERLTKSLTEQLQAHGSSLSAIKANQVLLALGIIEEQSRPSSKGTRKFFKVLTEEGLQYGKNLISEKNERETQPHYYTDTFLELLDKINQWLEQQK